jgi:hypothetical protein
VGTRADDLERIVGPHDCLAAEGPAKDVDGLGWKVREIAERLVLDLAVLAIRSSQKNTLVLVVAVLAADLGDVAGTARSGFRHEKKMAPRADGVQLLVATLLDRD